MPDHIRDIVFGIVAATGMWAALSALFLILAGVV